MTDPEYLIDTNICIYLLGGNADDLLARLERCVEGTIATSSIVFAEVMIGAVRFDAVDHASQFFRSIPVLSFDAACGHAYARLPFRRGSFDRLIAAHALALDLTLVTANGRDFADIPGLRVEDWTR